MNRNPSLSAEGNSTVYVAVSTATPSANASDGFLPTQWTQYGIAAQQGAFRVYGATVVAVPEPSAFVLAVTGMGALLLVPRRRKGA